MTNEDAGAFFQRLAALSELLDRPGAVFSETKAELYFEALRDLPLEAVIAGLNAAVRSCTFMPKPAEIRALVVGDDEDQAEIAWLDYKQQAKQIGGYGSPTLEPALADALVAVFGSWEAACWTDFTPEMWAAKRKEFGRVYRAMRQRGQSEPKALPGFFERENALHGYPASLPTAQYPALAEVDPVTVEAEDPRLIPSDAEGS